MHLLQEYPTLWLRDPNPKMRYPRKRASYEPPKPGLVEFLYDCNEEQDTILLGGSGDLVRRLRSSYGFLCGLMGDTNSTY